MSPYSRPSPRALFRDRRVQIGGVVALSAAALMGAGAIAILASSRAEATSPDMADHARLSVVAQPAPKPPIPVAYDKLATLDPEQVSAQKAEPIDPQLRTLLAEERRMDLESATEQRAFDARINAELQDTTAPADSRPAQRGGSTSNSEDVAETAPA